MDAIEQVFMHSIVAAPADDAPRLIFADWLEERGQSERAEFIRVQCRIADLNLELQTEEDCGSPGCPGCRERRDLQERERELAFKAAFWVAALPIPTEVLTGGCTWRRGFVERVRLSSEDWLRHADDLVRLTPLREVELTTVPTVIRKSKKFRLSEWPYSHRIWGFAGRESGVEIRGSSDARHRVELCLHAAWPEIRFVLPSAPPFSTAATVLRRNDGDAFELTGADHEIQVGDFVVQDEHGRIVRGNGPDGAAGIALSRMDANGRVMVRLVNNSTMQLHQNAAVASSLRRAMEHIAEDTAEKTR